jgi:Luciferase-like monooxygenase
MAMRGRRNSAGEDAARYTPSPAKQEDWSLLDHATACRHVAGFKNRSPAMKFGWLTLALSRSPDEDAVRIDQQIEQVCNAESLGFNDVWLTEHYFTGESVYNDALLFASALTMRTTCRSTTRSASRCNSRCSIT